jgi:hypothetical protein
MRAYFWRDSFDDPNGRRIEEYDEERRLRLGVRRLITMWEIALPKP